MAYDAFIKFDGIKGESHDSKHKGEIDVMSFSWGATQVGTSSMGGGGGSGKVSISDFHFVKKTDSASPIIFQKCATGDHIKEALFTVRKAGGEQIEYLKIKLYDVLVSSYQPSGTAEHEVSPRDIATGQASGKIHMTGGDEIPMEQVSLNFAKIEIDYQPQGPTGKAEGGAIHGGWDVKGNKKA